MEVSKTRPRPGEGASFRGASTVLGGCYLPLADLVPAEAGARPDEATKAGGTCGLVDALGSTSTGPR